MLNVKLYKQGDARWGDKVMKPGPHSLRSQGCLVTSVTMGVPNFTIDFDPGQMCDKLVTGGAFDQYSQLVWADLERVFPQLKVAGREDTTANKFHDANPVVIGTAIERLKRMVRYGQVVVMNVDLVGNDGVADHWVLLVDDQFNIHDPAFGESCHFSKRYGDPLIGLKGYAIIAGTPGWFLDDATKEEKDRGVAIGQAVILTRKYPNDPVVKSLFDGLTR